MDAHSCRFEPSMVKAAGKSCCPAAAPLLCDLDADGRVGRGVRWAAIVVRFVLGLCV